MNPYISVIVPVYNAAATLHRCVDSLLAQTCGNIEIILINDGSTDVSGALCNDYARKHENIITIHKENGGVSTARNAGIVAARGTYLGFVDSDDWIEPEMYSVLLAALYEHGAQIAACGYAIHRFDGTVIENMVEAGTPAYLGLGEALESLVHPHGIQGFLCNKLFDRKLLTELGNGGPLLLDRHIHVCEDLLYVSQCVEAAGFVVYDSRPLYVYCVRDYGGPANYNREKRISEFLALERLVSSWSRLSPELGAYIKRKYTNEAYHILRAAALAGDRDYYPALRGHLRRFLGDFLRSDAVTFKRKARILLAYALPDLENRVSAALRQR